MPVHPSWRRAYQATACDLAREVCRALGGEAVALQEFPFLRTFLDQADTWRGMTWHERDGGFSPLAALGRAAGLDASHLRSLFAVGLPEEDSRFGLVFEALQASPGQRRCTAGLLHSLWPESRSELRALEDLGLVVAASGDAPRAESALHVPGSLWETLRGDRSAHPAPGLTFIPPESLPSLDTLLLPVELRRTLARLEPGAGLVVRGPSHNGRRTLLRAMARAQGRGILEVAAAPPEDPRWRLLGPLCTLLHATPLVHLDLAPGETAHITALQACDSAMYVVMGPHGGLDGEPVQRCANLRMPLPPPEERAVHWRGAGVPLADPLALARRFRFTTGTIRAAARIAAGLAQQETRPTVEIGDVVLASRALSRASLETLATPLEAVRGWDRLAVPPPIAAELAALELRCRHRERLCAAAGPALAGTLTSGVRALFAGPSGTGKTLAARLLAGALDMDLYRLDLAAVVNKYIGETEKSLNQVFSRAEEMDVILLLDEGDALMTRRTAVSSSNDRYANLETNFLLQRLDSFEGILLVTTNALDRIDAAFQRRMDTVIEMGLPDAAERRRIWLSHLPVDQTLSQAELSELADRCRLSGAQIRNAALHATLLALEANVAAGRGQVWPAVLREYRKLGATCPLRGI